MGLRRGAGPDVRAALGPGRCAVLLARLVTVLVLAGRGWEFAAERVTVGVPLGLLAAAVAIGLLVRDRRSGRTGSTAARVALWCAAGASAVSLVLTGVVGYPGGPGAADMIIPPPAGSP